MLRPRFVLRAKYITDAAIVIRITMLLRGAVGFSKAEELFGSLLIQNDEGRCHSTESARRRGYLAAFRAIVLCERGTRKDPNNRAAVASLGPNCWRGTMAR